MGAAREGPPFHSRAGPSPRARMKSEDCLCRVPEACGCCEALRLSHVLVFPQKEPATGQFTLCLIPADTRRMFTLCKIKILAAEFS